MNNEVRRRRLSRHPTATTTPTTPPSDVLGQEAEFVWHKDTDLKGADVVDPARRLRARRLPAHRRDGALLADHARGAGVRRRAAARCSASATASRSCSRPGLLPGAMLRNRGLKFQCEHVHIRVEQTDTPFTRGVPSRARCCGCPIAHGEGNYFAEPDVIARLEANRQVIFRYTDAERPRRRRGESERIGGGDRRHLQRGAQRRRPDAASRARVRIGARQRRRRGSCSSR